MDSDQNKTPQITVALMTYNAAPYIAAALQSVLDQTFADFEIVIVDDASTDDTVNVVKTFTDPRIRFYRNEKNLGYAGNFNRAVELARCDLIALPGADDIWEAEYLQRAVDCLNAGATFGFVHTSAVWIDSDGVPFGRSNPGWRTITAGRDGFLQVLRVGFCLPSITFRTPLLRQIGPLPAWWAGLADSWLVLHLCLISDVAYIDRDLVRYRVHDKSISLTMYHSGEYFRHHRDIIASAFDWPETRAAGLDRFRRRGLRYVASDSIKLLHVNRRTMGRWAFLKLYFSLVVGNPTVLIYPHVWARLFLGLMPRTAISRLRDWKRRRWQGTTSNAANSVKPTVLA